LCEAQTSLLATSLLPKAKTSPIPYVHIFKEYKANKNPETITVFGVSFLLFHKQQQMINFAGEVKVRILYKLSKKRICLEGIRLIICKKRRKIKQN